MKRNCKNTNISGHFNERILLFVDSAEVKDRVRALDILGQYLIDIYNSGLTTDLFTTSKISVSFAILTRCDDISPDVRAKALTVLGRVAENILKFFDEIKDKTVLKTERGVDISDLELNVNGEHRFFWYCMADFEERKKELMNILCRRIEDNYVLVRKAAIIAFEKLMTIDATFVNSENLTCLKSAFKDSSGLIRQQTIQSVSRILKTYQTESQIQELWLKGILPLIEDPEIPVQSTALSLLEELFVLGIFSLDGSDENLSMALLKKLTTADFLVYQKFLKRAFSEWKLKNKLKAENLNKLKQYNGTQWEECLWLYISFFTKCSGNYECPQQSATRHACAVIPLEFSDLCVQFLHSSLKQGEYPSFMEYVMKVLLHIHEYLPLETLVDVQCNISNGLESFSISVKYIPISIEILFKISKLKGTISEVEEFSSALVQNCENYLSDIQSKALFHQPHPDDDAIANCICTLTEIYLLYPSYIRSKAIGLLKCFVGCVEFPAVLSLTVKAHALVALGKICLQDTVLSRELLPVFAEEVRSKHDVIRCNACTILIDLCKCYSSFADINISLVSACFKDPLYLIRYQTIVRIIDLLQGEYIKWKEKLFFGFLSTLIDKKEVIQELGHYSFCHYLVNSEKQLFLEYFVHSIFVLNFFAPPNDEEVAQNVKKLATFSIPGEKRRKKRMVIYRFLLEHMSVKEKMKAIESTCSMLMNVAESVYPLNKLTECITRDCFSIFTCEEIKTINFESIKDLDEQLEDQLNNFEIELRRVVLVDPVVKVIRNLSRSIKNPESDLMCDIILFLKDLLIDYIDDIGDILVEDKILLNLLQLEIRKDGVKKQMIIKRKKDLLTSELEA